MTEGLSPGAECCAVAFLDIDHFGDHNKHRGQDQVDNALGHVAQIIQATARRGDRVFRKGGEEFAVVLPGASEDEERLAAEPMRLAVEQAAIRYTESPMRRWSPPLVSPLPTRWNSQPFIRC